MTGILEFQVVNITIRRLQKAHFHHRARENAERTKKTIAIRWVFSLFVCEPSHCFEWKESKSEQNRTKDGMKTAFALQQKRCLGPTQSRASETREQLCLRTHPASVAHLTRSGLQTWNNFTSPHGLGLPRARRENAIFFLPSPELAVATAQSCGFERALSSDGPR